MIIEHGHWSLTTVTEQQRVLHAHRDDTGMDWYVFVGLKPFKEGSVVMTVGPIGDGENFMVQAATRDPTAIFPAGMLVIEETEYGGNAPFNDYHGRLYANGAIGEPWVPPPPLFTLDQYKAFTQDVLRRIEALEAKVG